MRAYTAKEKAKDYHLRTTYGITLEDYEKMLEKQDFKCALCSKPASECARSLHVDHWHKKAKGAKFGKVRGLVCFYCNRERIRQHTLRSSFLLYQYMLRFAEENLNEPAIPESQTDSTD